MIFNMVVPGAEEKFAFEYSGTFTDNRDENGIGTVRFTSSGILEIVSGLATCLAYILGGGGGGARTYGTSSSPRGSSGGGGGYQTVAVILNKGDVHEITIGAGGAAGPNQHQNYGSKASAGGNTTAFGYTSTGGKGGLIYNGGSAQSVAGGTPNGASGTIGSPNAAGGSPNGGSVASSPSAGSAGYVELTFE